MRTWVELPFAGGTYVFKFGLAQIDEMERACDAGLGEIYARVLKGRWGEGDDEVLPTEAAYRFRDLLSVIKHGLIGGNEGSVDGHQVSVSPTRATELVDNYIVNATDARIAVKEAWKLAAAILYALIEGYTPPKKDEPGTGPATQGSD